VSTESTENNAQEAMKFSLTDETEETDTAVKDAGRVCFFCDKARS